MGVGKTTLIKAIVKHLGSNDNVSSPTFSIVNEYSLGTSKIYHFDLYRLDSEEEAYDIGIEEMLYGGGICFIEWPKKIEGLFPENTIWVYIRINESLEREISVNID
jgi:tRNA threonylcarbamoyladenosine biosynthesis protein TsaE